MKEIEMIASFPEKGLPHPHRFRLVAEDETLVVVNINKILFCEENKRDSTIQYRCNCIINDSMRTVDIYFNKINIKWFLNI